jgi:imidazolonepropionase
MWCDRIWTNARLATMRPDLPGLGMIEDGIVACAGERIVYAGPAAEAPELNADDSIDCAGRLITPGLIDCHTHLVHAGNRADEFERRLAGASYEEIARQGGGILSTVRATRDASEDALIESALPRLDALMSEGITTVEVKSGYGLSLDDERKMLRAIRGLGHRCQVSVVATFLGAHALPPEYADDPDGYLDLIVDKMIPAIAAEHLADAVDGYCESIGFSPDQIDRLFAVAKSHGLPVRLHAEQLSNLEGAALAARHGALSADHLEYLSGEGVAAMARAGTTAVLLPGAFYFMRETQLPPIDALRQAGVPMAIATDYNPGTSPLTSPLLAMNLAATLFRMTVEECLLGFTRNAAGALGLNEVGTLEADKYCDLALWDVASPAELVYRIGFNPLEARVWRGR